ncbi:hypothetical protein P8625_14160 [Tenacibaculum tangerinum]|uniref:Uncharacterized protein n=1 Tax=Tenacibaculum tangerinum TaxID=3038772 RepID=A0ABY8L5K1_9FLAO|nr:hypothetical protein [Tenacibaculum tangerinum]WGH75200.1 hypothetical protein P8625_14160 [Tenacibaculum tangerinum]
MKYTIVKTVFILFVGVSFALTTKQNKFIDPIKIVATFQGYDEYGYTFSFENEEGDEDVITFETISEELLKVHNLQDDTFIGEVFEITYDFKVLDDEVETPVLQSIKKIE